MSVTDPKGVRDSRGSNREDPRSSMRMDNPADFDIASELDGNFSYGRGSLTAPKVCIYDSDFYYLYFCLDIIFLFLLIFYSMVYGVNSLSALRIDFFSCP